MGLVSGGVDFVGFIVRPSYILVRRRTLGNLKQKIRRMQRELVEERAECTLYRFDHVKLQKFLATLNSYLGHLQYGRCNNFLIKLWQSNGFLSIYFSFDRRKVSDRFRGLRRGNLTLRRQVKWLHQMFREQICFVQVGCYFEVFGDKALVVAKTFGFKLLKNWRGWAIACGFHQRLLPAVVQRCIERRIAVVVVRQTGRESAFARERLPALLIQPNRPVEMTLKGKGG